MLETVTVVPFTTAVPAVAVAVNGPVPDVTAKVIEYVCWSVAQTGPDVNVRTGTGLTTTVVHAVSLQPNADVTITE
jgi:hypothetical protein